MGTFFDELHSLATENEYSEGALGGNSMTTAIGGQSAATGTTSGKSSARV